MAHDIKCVTCGSTFRVSKGRKDTAKFCSKLCSNLGKVKPANARCCMCGKSVKRKPSQLKKRIGTFCDSDCHAAYRSENYLGSKNPNYKNAKTDSDGYMRYVPASPAENLEKKLHRAVVAEVLGVDKLPASVHIHHRDCRILNNEPGNLAMMTASDHKWLHKQFGNATLWVIMNGLLDPEQAKNWSDNPSRASRLLYLDCRLQKVARNYSVYTGGDTDADTLMAEFEIVRNVEFEEVVN